MNHWFLIAIGLWITIVIPSWMRVIWIGVFGIWLERKKRKTCLLYVICLILLSFPWIKTIEQPPETLVGTVTSLKNSGFIVTTKQQNVWVNRNAEVGLDDEVVVACELQKINSLNNRVGYSFEEWANHHHIWYQCKSHSVNVIKKGNTLRAKALRSIRTMPLETAKVMNMFVFHLYESDSDWLYLGLSLGIQISFLLQCIRKLASYFLKERTVQKVLWFVTLCIGCFYRFDFLSVRYLIRDTLKFTSWNKKEQWGILWVILLCLFPNEATELKFLIPMGIGLISCFGTRNHSIVVYCYIILLQLYQNGVVAIDSFVYMFLFRPVFSMMYLFCVLRFCYQLMRYFRI